MKQEPDSAVPLRTRAVPEANEALQVAALQSIPEGALVTTPEPVPDRVTARESWTGWTVPGVAIKPWSPAASM
jgi:hypothetical protein